MANVTLNNLVDKDILSFVLNLFKNKIETNINSSNFQNEDLVVEIVNEAIKKVVGDAPETFDTLKEIADYLSENDDTLAALLKSLDDKVSKSDAVIYLDTSNENNPNRRSIVLDNHSNLLGKGTDGGAYNIAMVSKWDVVDMGTTSLPINLNGSELRPTYNDDKLIALLEDIDKKLAEKFPDIVDGYVTKVQLNETLTNYVKVETLDNYVTAEELNKLAMTEQEAKDLISNLFKD